MNPQLSSYVTSFSNQSRRTIKSVLSSTYLEKAELGRLVEKVSSFLSPADYAPRIISPLEPVQRNIIVDMFRDMDLRIKSQYDISNSISLLSSSMTNIFGGELQKIEKDLEYLDTYINNYSFISGEDDLYNRSFIENFDNESNSYLSQSVSQVSQDGVTTNIPDRNGQYFLLEESAKVDQITGVLKFSSGFEQVLQKIDKNDVQELYYETNFAPQYITSDTGVEKILNNINSKVWSVTVKSPFVIKESILDKEQYSAYKNDINLIPSAQIALTIKFSRLIQMSRVRINPNYAEGMQIGQIIIETESSSESGMSSLTTVKKGMLNAPVLLDRYFDIDFDQTYMVKSMTIVFMQTNYKRTKINPVQSETNSKVVSEIVKQIRHRRREKHDSLQDYVIKFFLNDTEKSFIIRNKKLYNYNLTQYYPTTLSETNFGVIEKLDRNTYFSDLDSFNKFKNTSLLSNVIFSIIAYSLGSRLRNQVSTTYVESNIKDSVKPISGFLSSGIVPVGDSNIVDANLHFVEHTINSISKNDASQLMNATEERIMYEYTFSTKGIAFYSTVNSQQGSQYSTRSFFVSNKIPTSGRPIKAKMLADYFQETRYAINESGRDKTSAEFSVCIADDISKESNWIPIVPFTDSFIRTEVLFPNANGQSILRFEPLIETVSLYEDRVKRVPGTFLVSGKVLNISNYNQNKKYFVSYTPKDIGNFKEVQLHSSNLSSPILSSPNFDGSNGELFSSTLPGNRVRLAYDPYIDQSKLSGATYSPIVGTITSSVTSFGNFDNSNYSPVKVLLSDGTTARNMTNYILNDYQTESFENSNDLMFIHSGDTLTFNRPINSNFRVLYQYIPDSFRYRVVLRSITSDTENYSVNRLIFKFSTENNDQQLINLIKYDNLFKNKIN